MCEAKQRRQQPDKMQFCTNCVSMITRRKEKIAGKFQTERCRKRCSRSQDFKRKVNFLSGRLALLFTTAEATDCGCVDLETEGVIPPAGSRATGRQDKVEAAAWWEEPSSLAAFHQGCEPAAITARVSSSYHTSLTVPEVWWPSGVDADWCQRLVPSWAGHMDGGFNAASCYRRRL